MTVGTLQGNLDIVTKNLHGNLDFVAKNLQGNLANVSNNDSTVQVARKAMSRKTWFTFFIFAHAVSLLAEPLLVAFGRKTIDLQLAVLTLSTFLFLVGELTTHQQLMNPEPSDLIDERHFERLRGFRSLSLVDKCRKVLDPPVVLEMCLLLWGWCTIFSSLGLSALRCFRVFRLLWYSQLLDKVSSAPSNKETFNAFNPRAFQLCLTYIQKLGREIFTQSSRGGVVVLSLFFYTTYLFAVVYHGEQNDIETPEGYSCGTLSSCFMTLLRLSFYDGNGFDYMSAMLLSDQRHNRGYAALLIFYMLITSIMLLNGLIGIFGSAFIEDEDGDGQNDMLSRLDLLLVKMDSLQREVGDIGARLSLLEPQSQRAPP